MIHVFRRFLPLILGPIGGLLGSLFGLGLHQLLCRALRNLWPPWPTWHWTIGLLAYSLLGFLLALPFLSVYPGQAVALRSELGRAQDAHLRTWIALLFASYLPIGVGVLYQQWWGAPAVAIPFTDTYLYAGSRGDLLTGLVSIAVLGSFCGVGVERVSRGLPRVIRVLLGPPLVVVLTMAGALAAVLAVVGIVAAGAEPAPLGPLMQPLSQAGWDSNLLVALLTVVSGCLAGTLAMLTVALPVLSGLPDVYPARARRRWGLPLVGVAASGAIALAALVQGYGADSVSWFRGTIHQGQQGIVGCLVAPNDVDVYALDIDREGFYVFEFPSPELHGRHQLVVPGQVLPTARNDRVRYLIEGTDYTYMTEIQLSPSWPPRVGVSPYTGPVRLARAEDGELQRSGGVTILDVGPGDLVHWSADLDKGQADLLLRTKQAAYWTVLGPRSDYESAWTWEPGWSVVTLRGLSGGRQLIGQVLDAEGYGAMVMNVLIASAHGGIDPPELRWLLTPSRPPQGSLRIPIVAEGRSADADRVHPTGGMSVLSARAGEVFSVHPQPGGTFTVARVVARAAGKPWLERRRDDGSWEEVAGEFLLLGETRLRVSGLEPGAEAVVVLGGSREPGLHTR